MKSWVGIFTAELRCVGGICVSKRFRRGGIRIEEKGVGASEAKKVG